ncbi:hypothetical protein EIN43_24285 [Enterobacter hormaechei]|uniref:N-acetylmuramoyl-L-alanine amidase n=1 Tax=Enterobacter hormaechei TaxID=158836 RepID=A0A4Y5ZQ29_9ENTR|nr:hypothetical protein EIN43_24285 [Enterobacter hormaechei]
MLQFRPHEHIQTIKSTHIASSGSQSGAGGLNVNGHRKAGSGKEESTLKTSNGHSKPKTKSRRKASGHARSSHGGSTPAPLAETVRKKTRRAGNCKNVRAILRSNGIDARLTRTGDTFIPLYDRVEIAHKHGADLFMSIHADGFTNPSAAGASVFALQPWRQ